MKIVKISQEDRQNLISTARLLRREKYNFSARWLDDFIDRMEEE